MKNWLILIVMLFKLHLNAQDLSQGLVGYYPFYGSAIDYSISANNGSISGASLSNDRFGNTSRSYSFSPGQYINLGNPSSLAFSSGSFTISLWCKTGGNGTTMALVQKYTGGSSVKGYGLEIGPSGKIVFFTSNGTGNTGNPPDSYNLFGNKTITDNIWHLITAIYDDTQDSLILFVDNLKDNAVYCPTSPAINTSNVNIGRREWNNLIHFSGMIDEVRFYQRAITETEISQIYHFDGLVAYYPFSQNSNDYSGFGYHGTMNNLTSVNDRLGVTNSAFNFNGSSSYCNIISKHQLAFLQGEYSLSAWISTNSSSNQTMGIVQKYTGGSPAIKGYGLEINAAGYPLFFVSNGTGISGFPPDSYNILGTINVRDGKWHLLTVTYNDLLDTLKLYIDGKINKSEYCPSNPALNSANINIGRREWNNLIYYTGSIDEVRFYDVELTSDLISKMYDISNVNVLEAVKSSVKIYPNPFSDVIFIDGLTNESKYNIKVVSLDYRTVLCQKVNILENNSLAFDSKELPLGIYFLFIEDEYTKITSVHQIVKYR